jgi:putative flippase GtrA
MKADLKHSYKEIIRFGVVGCVAVAIQYIVYWLLLFVMPYNAAYTIGYIVSFMVNYLLTTSYTFKTKRSKKTGVGFIGCHVVNYLLQTFLLNVFVYFGCSDTLAPIPVFAICVPTNFLLVRMVMKNAK